MATELGNISRACKIMGYSRDSYYRFKKLYDSGGEQALRGANRRRPSFKNRVNKTVEDACVKLALEYPSWGRVRASKELTRRGFRISPTGVRCVWLRNNLATPEKRKEATGNQ